MDESRVYWTQYAYEDLQPQFKNDHQKLPAASVDDDTSTVESLHPPKPSHQPLLSSPSPPTIYQMDDPHDGRQRNDGDQRFVSTRRKEIDAVSGQNAAAEKDYHGRMRFKFMDDDKASEVSKNLEEDIVDNKSTDGDSEHDSSNWKSEQHRSTIGDRLSEDDKDASQNTSNKFNGYHILTCRVINNFYTHYRW